MIEGNFDARTLANMYVALDRNQSGSSMSFGRGSLRPSFRAPRAAGCSTEAGERELKRIVVRVRLFVHVVAAALSQKESRQQYSQIRKVHRSFGGAHRWSGVIRPARHGAWRAALARSALS
jgi:hypothetical protein